MKWWKFSNDLNATKYSLLDIEINNAVYAGALKQYAENLASDPFFEKHRVFNALDLKRMGDLRYALTVVITMLQGYFNRDDAFQLRLERYNDEFPRGNEISDRFTRVVEFIEERGFTSGSRLWRKADLFTLLIELDIAFRDQTITLQPSEVVDRLQDFYSSVDSLGLEGGGSSSIYYKAALQASNDGINRVRRGTIVGSLLRKIPDEKIIMFLAYEGLI